VPFHCPKSAAKSTLCVQLLLSTSSGFPRSSDDVESMEATDRLGHNDCEGCADEVPVGAKREINGVR